MTVPTQAPFDVRVVKGTATGIMPPAVNGMDFVVSDPTDPVFIGI
jgi:hypothetical protein